MSILPTNDVVKELADCKEPPLMLKHIGINSLIKRIKKEERMVAEYNALLLARESANPRIRERKECEDICSGLREVLYKKQAEEARRKQLRNGTYDLQELDFILREAASKRELADQLRQLQQRIDRKTLDKCEEKRQVAADIAKYQCEKSLQEEQERAKRTEHRKQLQLQIQEREERRRKERELKQEEHKQMKELVEKYRQEDEETQRKRDAFRARERKESLDFYAMQEEFKRTQKQQVVEEDKQLQEMLDEREREQQRLKDLKKANLELRAKIAEGIGLSIVEKELKKRRAEEQLIELLIEEREMQKELREQEDLNHVLQVRKEMHDNWLDRQEREMALKQAKHYERTVLASVSNHSRIEEDERRKLEEIAEKKARAELNHKHNMAVLETVQTRRNMLAAAILEQNEFYKRQVKDFEAEIEAEKLRIFHSQPIELLRYLPPKMLHQRLLPEDLMKPVIEEHKRTPFIVLTRTKHLPC